MPTQLSFERTPLTMLLLGCMVVLEVMGVMDPDSRRKFYEQWFGLTPDVWDWTPLAAGEFWRWPIWRPFTTTLLHGEFMFFLHALFNILMFAQFGAAIEGWLTWRRMLPLILLLAFASTLSQSFWDNWLLADRFGQFHGSVGFSGVNCGLFGFIWFSRRYRPELWQVCHKVVVETMIGWFFLCILLDWLGYMGIANIAHGVGLGMGALISLAAYSRRRRWLWCSLLGVATALTIGLLLLPPKAQRRDFVGAAASIPGALGGISLGVTNLLRPERPAEVE